MSDLLNSEICLVSGHYPSGVTFAEVNKWAISEYAKVNSYDFYYDSETKVPKEDFELHFRRSLLLIKAAKMYPNAKWYIWLDTDIYPNSLDTRIESQIDLTNPTILYHLFHERPWHFLVNTGVKIVHRDAIPIEEEIYQKRESFPYPFEQKAMVDYVLPKFSNRIIIHDPGKMNCIYDIHDIKKGLFIHVCARKEVDRNLISLVKTRHLFKNRRSIHTQKFYKSYYSLVLKYSVLKLKSVLKNRNPLKKIIPSNIFQTT